MKTKTPMKQYLCVEHGEEFLVEAKSPQDAREQAAMWGGEFIREYKPRKARQTTPATSVANSAKLDRLKKRHVEVIKDIFLDITKISIPADPRKLMGKVVLALDEDLWEKHRDLQWKIFLAGGNPLGKADK